MLHYQGICTASLLAYELRVLEPVHFYSELGEQWDSGILPMPPQQPSIEVSYAAFLEALQAFYEAGVDRLCITVYPGGVVLWSGTRRFYLFSKEEPRPEDEKVTQEFLMVGFLNLFLEANRSEKVKYFRFAPLSASADSPLFIDLKFCNGEYLRATFFSINKK